MLTLHDKLTEQFYRWELRGRGWQVWDVPVSPEPPFRPFYGHYIQPEEIPDDGRRPGLLSSLVKAFAKEKEEPPPLPPEEEPEPEILERDSLVEIHASLPPQMQVSKEAFEQFILSLGYCREPVSFELIGSENSIVAQLTVSQGDAGKVQQQLEAHFPDAVFTQHTGTLETQWSEIPENDIAIAEFGLSREFIFSLSTGNLKIDPFIGITGALSNLQPGELGLFQVIFQPVREPWSESILRSVTDGAGGDFFVNAPELAKEAKSKISRPLFAAVVRVAVKTEQDGRAWEIARALAGALTVYSNPHGNEFIPLKNDGYDIYEHEEDVLRRQSRRSGMILNSDELISLVHLPSSSVRSPKLKREAQKSKAAPKIVLNASGLVLGENVHAGKSNIVTLTGEQRVRHTYVIGASGTGKSTLLFNLIKQDIDSGQGLAVLDPHGDLIEKILGNIPPSRIDDVVLVDPSDEEFSVGFNILSAHSDLEKNLLASDLVSVFQRLSTSWGDQMGSVLNNAILAFLESKHGGTLADLRRFLIEPAFRNQFLKSVNDPDNVYYWQKGFPLLSGNKSIGPVLTRLETFLSPKPIRYMVSQKENRLDFSEIMNHGKIFLAKLSQGKMGKENSYLLGSLLVAKFHQTAMSRQNMPESQRRNFWLYMDEFQNFITPSMAEILTGARKYRVGLILAHQELRQLQRDSEVASAVLSNPYTRVCFRVGDQDAKALESGFSFFEAKDLQNLGTGEAICRVERSDFDFNLSVPLLPETEETIAAEIRNRVITSSRKKYALPRSEIETLLRKNIATEIETPSVPRPAKEVACEQPTKAQTVSEVPKQESAAALPALIIKPEEQTVLPVSEPPKISEFPKPPPYSEIVRPLEPKQEPKKVEPSLPGIGGAEHKRLQHFVTLLAQNHGFLYTVEQPILKGAGKIDVALEKSGKKIACQICHTSPPTYEIGSIKKCFDAGFDFIVLLGTEKVHLDKIRKIASAEFSSDKFGRLRFGDREEMGQVLIEFAAALASNEVVSHGRKVTVSYRPLDDDENAKRRAEMVNAASQTKKKKK